MTPVNTVTGSAAPVRLSRPQAGTVAVSGDLSFDTAEAALVSIRGALAEHAAQVLDLGGVDRSDSAGLACVLAVLAQAGSNPLSVRQVPVGMQALAKVCAVDHLLV